MLPEVEILDARLSDVSTWCCRASVQLSAPQDVPGAWDSDSRKLLHIPTAAVPWFWFHSPMPPVPNHMAGTGEVKLPYVLFTYTSA